MKNKIEKLNDIILKGAPFKNKGLLFNRDTNLAEDFGYDSLTFINLILALETEFDIEFDINMGYLELSSYEKLKEYILTQLTR